MSGGERNAVTELTELTVHGQNGQYGHVKKLHLEFRVLDSYFHSGRREVEHVENDGFGATVLATMDGTNNLY